jgi:hypothetical protein
MDNQSDGTTDTYTLRLKKTVQFYAEDSSGGYTGIDGNTYRLMGGDDGTLAKTVSSSTFTVDVSNEEATAGSSGSGSSSAS